MDAGIKSQPISAHNATSNAIIETVHKTIGQVIRTLVNVKPPRNQEEADKLVRSACATATHACRSTSNSALGGFSSGALVFNRDMHLDIPIVADILSLQKLRQAKIDLRLLQANAKRTRHEFKVNDLVYVHNRHKSSEKLKPVYDGPFPIIQVHTNNTCTVLRKRNVEERITIRRLKPQKK